MNVSPADDCQACTLGQRVWRYLLLRLREPTTWAGIFTVASGIGISVKPELQTEITSVGTGVVGLLFILAREGRNKPDNPSAMTTIKGAMPPQKPAIVPPPSTDTLGTVAIDPAHVPVDAEGELHAPSSKGGEP